MLLFDGFDLMTRIIKLRPRQLDTCIMCKHAGSNENDRESLKNILDNFDYSQFCGVKNYNDKTSKISLLNEQYQRITCKQYNELKNEQNTKHLLIDVRPKCQFNICALSDSFSN